jgi:hypothetical protein
MEKFQGETTKNRISPDASMLIPFLCVASELIVGPVAANLEPGDGLEKQLDAFVLVTSEAMEEPAALQATLQERTTMVSEGDKITGASLI